MDPQSREKLACSWFFAVPALVYGILTSRLPAIKNLLAATDAQIGYLLLTLGSSTLVALAASGLLLDRLGARNMLAASSIFLAIAISLAVLALNWPWLLICCALAGLGVGFCDVAMNAQGIFIEQKHNILCLSFLHAVSGLGGVAGSLGGSLCAALNLSPFLNFILLLTPWFLLWPWAIRHTPKYAASTPAAKKGISWRTIPALIIICGIMSLICHVAEGSVGEWGSILLHSVKGASKSEAALVFAAFTGSLVLCRFAADGMRARLGDFSISLAGSIIGALGMILVLLSPWPALCLTGYSLMGLGLAPIAPILFSIAGANPRMTPGRASGIISVFSYAGLLFFPPFLGMLAHAYGLINALWLIVACCLLLMAGSFSLRCKND